ncbi:hypothetical protein WMY93_022934 [Mugilogobius chulae]|uniref:Uncharacterized protein n=1 Tax=Mugilogobius chulae TaxID=88201 RepID=A0AAW0N605_9GOBI
MAPLDPALFLPGLPHTPAGFHGPVSPGREGTGPGGHWAGRALDREGTGPRALDREGSGPGGQWSAPIEDDSLSAPVLDWAEASSEDSSRRGFWDSAAGTSCCDDAASSESTSRVSCEPVDYAARTVRRCRRSDRSAS